MDVSLGAAPEIKTMPNLVPGWKQADAERALDNLLLDLKIVVKEENNNEVPAGEIIRTEPVADTALAVGQEVVLYVSLGVKPGVMPDLIGYDQETVEAIMATQSMKQLNLEIVYEEIFDQEVPQGSVVRTNPEADVEIKSGDLITIYVSKGKEKIELPNVLNLSADSAVNILKTEGIENYKLEPVENEKPKDTVLELKVDGVTVEPGTEIDLKATVTIVVSTGPAVKKTKTVEVALPEDVIPPYKVSVYLAGTLIFEQDIPEENEAESISVDMTGSGVQEYSVYIGSTIFITKEVDFTK